MKFYLVTIPDPAYGASSGAVVRAENPERALQISEDQFYTHDNPYNPPRPRDVEELAVDGPEELIFSDTVG